LNTAQSVAEVHIPETMLLPQEVYRFVAQAETRMLLTSDRRLSLSVFCGIKPVEINNCS
jgi:hypothetical protein